MTITATATLVTYAWYIAPRLPRVRFRCPPGDTTAVGNTKQAEGMNLLFAAAKPPCTGVAAARDGTHACSTKAAEVANKRVRSGVAIKANILVLLLKGTIGSTAERNNLPTCL